MSRLDSLFPRAPAVPTAPGTTAPGGTTPAEPANARPAARATTARSVTAPDLDLQPGASAAAKLIQTPTTHAAVGLPPDPAGDAGTFQDLDVHTAAAGESWATIAAQYGVSEASLRAANGDPQGTAAAPQAGTALQVPALATAPGATPQASGEGQAARRFLLEPPCLRALSRLLPGLGCLLGTHAGSRDGTLGRTRPKIPRGGQADT